MKIFISWSGKLSHEFALILDEWIHCVLPYIQTFMSSKSIEPGTRWSKKISEELQSCNAGIICLSNENIFSPWVNFEAGAISKFIDISKVIPILIGISNKDISISPLSQFQTLSTQKEDLKKLLILLFEIMEIENTNTNQIFEKWWKDLDLKIKKLKLPKKNNSEKDKYELLLKNFNNLNENVTIQMLQVKEILADLTSSNFVTNKEISTKFSNLSGNWQNKLNETIYYGIFIENNLHFAYAYENKIEKMAHFHSIKIIGDRLYGRFQWFYQNVHGFFYLDMIDDFTLEGEWFYTEEVAFEKLEDIDKHPKSGKFIYLEKLNSKEKPFWLKKYIDEELYKVLY